MIRGTRGGFTSRVLFAVLPALILVLAFGLVAGCRSESTGGTVTVPDEAVPAGEDPDMQVLLQLEEAGSDLSKEHSIEFFFYFPTEAQARAATGEIAGDGFEVLVEPAVEGSEWHCLVRKSMVPDHQALVDIGSRFESIADRHDGEYDGWGTEVVR